MSGAPPAGFVGHFLSERPFLAAGLAATGIVALIVAGARVPGAGGLIAAYALNVAYVLAAPLLLAALTPRKDGARALFIAGVAALAAILAALGENWFGEASRFVPPAPATLAAAALFFFIVALSPMALNVARLGGAAPAAASFAAVGAAAMFALEGAIEPTDQGLVCAVALTLGAGLGYGVASDFARAFAAGARREEAAAAAAHQGLSGLFFALLVAAGLFGVSSFKANPGRVDWLYVSLGLAASAMTMAAGVIASTGVAAIAPASEQTAVDENRRRYWFAEAWRPVRGALPATTAFAAMAVVGVALVIALFEAGVADPLSLFVFLALVWAGAALAYVSLRTSVLITALIAIGAILADYAYALAGATPPAFDARLAGLALNAAALGHLMVSWRDAGERLRNPRDIVEAALGDGARRYLFMAGAGAASFFISMRIFAWRGGLDAMIYFLTVALITLVIAPPAMTAMSARFSRP